MINEWWNILGSEGILFLINPNFINYIFKKNLFYRELEELINEADSKKEGVVNYQGERFLQIP